MQMYCMEQVSPLKMRCIRRVSNLQLPSVRAVQASEKKKASVRLVRSCNIVTSLGVNP